MKVISQYCKGNVVGTCNRMNRWFDFINKILCGKADRFFALVITPTRLRQPIVAVSQLCCCDNLGGKGEEV